MTFPVLAILYLSAFKYKNDKGSLAGLAVGIFVQPFDVN
jgi:hypothetical protein